MENLHQRFIDKVIIDKASGCWVWVGAKAGSGYGCMKLAWREAPVGAHRISMHLFKNFSLSNDAYICHHCDNKLCVNPEHLYVGDRRTNIQDAVARGRLRTGNQKGEHNGNAKLTTEQVQEIKTRIAKGENNTEIARDYPVGHSMVSLIRRGKAWADV